jgi:quercetin dioxygenase-like cupin family protein
MTQARADRPHPMQLQQYALHPKLEAMRGDTPIKAHGRDALTLVRDPDANVVLVALEAGGQLHEHVAPGALSLVVLEGRIAFTAQGQRLEAKGHDLLTLPAGVPHAVEAIEPSSILLVISAPRRRT